MSWLGNLIARAKWIVGRHPQDPVLADLLSAGESLSGVNITRKTALECPPLFRCVSLIAGHVAKLPAHVYERLPTEGKRRATEHAAYRLIRRKPNGETTAGVWKETITGNAILQGNGYSYVKRRGDGAPEETWWLDPDRTYPVRENGRKWYVYQLAGGEYRKLYPDDVIHIHGFGYDGMMGYSLLDLARESLGLGIAAQRYGTIYFKNSGRTNIALEHPKRLSKTARQNLRRSWEKLHTGLENAHRPAILAEGMTLKPYTINHEDSQLLQTLKHHREDIALWTGTPPHKAGAEGRTAYASLEQENKAFLDDCLDCWLVRWEDELRDKLLSEDEKESESHFVEFAREALLRTDAKTEAEVLVLETNNGHLTIDEARAIKNRPPYPGGIGSKPRVPLNMGTLGETPPPTPPPPTSPASTDDATNDGDQAATQERAARLDAAHRASLVDAGQRAWRRLAVHARRAATRPERFTDWLEGVEHEHRGVLIDMLLPAVGAWLAGADRRDDPVAIAAGLVDGIFARLDYELDEISSRATVAELATEVDLAMTRLEGAGGGILADSVPSGT